MMGNRFLNMMYSSLSERANFLDFVSEYVYCVKQLSYVASVFLIGEKVNISLRMLVHGLGLLTASLLRRLSIVKKKQFGR